MTAPTTTELHRAGDHRHCYADECDDAARRDAEIRAQVEEAVEMTDEEQELADDLRRYPSTPCSHADEEQIRHTWTGRETSSRTQPIGTVEVLCAGCGTVLEVVREISAQRLQVGNTIENLRSGRRVTIVRVSRTEDGTVTGYTPSFGPYRYVKATTKVRRVEVAL